MKQFKEFEHLSPFYKIEAIRAYYHFMKNSLISKFFSIVLILLALTTIGTGISILWAHNPILMFQIAVTSLILYILMRVVVELTLHLYRKEIALKVLIED